MTKFEQIKSIKTVEDTIEFIMQFVDGNGTENVNVCTECSIYGAKGCYQKNICQPKIIENILHRKLILNFLILKVLLIFIKKHIQQRKMDLNTQKN